MVVTLDFVAGLQVDLEHRFGYSAKELEKYGQISKTDLLAAYKNIQVSRQFENSCAQAYMQQHIKGFMHLDNGHESVPALVGDSLKASDKKVSYYRGHTHAISSGVPMEKVMAELFAKDTGTCHGAGGSMHIFDKENNFQGGWALVAEHLPFAVGTARSILLDRHLDQKRSKGDDRISVLFVGEGGAQNGRMNECLNAAALEGLPILFLVIDNGRAINTFTPDVAINTDVYLSGLHYGIPGIKVNGQDLVSSLKAGRAVVDYVRTSGPAILQVHTYRFHGHSPADPEHERGRKSERRWARAEQDPIKIFEEQMAKTGELSETELTEVREEVKSSIRKAVNFARDSKPPSPDLAAKLEYPDSPNTNYNERNAPAGAKEVLTNTVKPEALAGVEKHIAKLHEQAAAGKISIGDAANLAILEEMIRDPKTVIHAEDLQAGSSYDIPKLTQQTFGTLRACDEIIDEGHFIGKALGEGLNGYRPIIELMNMNFGIYGMAEISSASNTYATTGGQFKMPMTIVGAGGTAPNQALGAEHSQPFHAYIMGIPGLKICTAASPDAAYSLTKSMIRDDGVGMLFFPVKQMKAVLGSISPGKCDPLNKCALLHEASSESVKNGKAVTVLTYLHGVLECQKAIEPLVANGMDIDLIELRSLKPLDIETIHKSVARTHKVAILDESTTSGGIGATISASVSEQLYYELDAPVKRLSMEDAPVPYASSMEEKVVKRATDVIKGITEMVK